MPPRPIVNDALWRCLCPSYSLKTPTTKPTRRAIASIACQPPCPAPPRSSCQRQLRAYSAATNTSPSFFSFGASKSQVSSEIRPRARSAKYSVVDLPTVELYEKLRRDGAAGRYDEVMSVIRILIKDRRERPNSAMYAAILHSFTSSTEGTAGKVRRVLEEMKADGVEIDSRCCHCTLEALAVHPDYLLRAEILDYMKERWFVLSDSGHNFVVAGMLRDRLFEQALEKMDEMIKKRIKIEDWLWDKTMWLLLDFGEVEEACQVLMTRKAVEGRLKMSDALWLQLLDHASRYQLAGPTEFIWNTQVVPGYIKPPTGACLNVLSTAARHGKAKLATDVFRVLTERNTVLQSDHYEMLIETYLFTNDLEAALSLLLIMQESGLKVEAGTVWPFFPYLRKDEKLPLEAFKLLQKFEASTRTVPTAAVNVCIQASIHQDRLSDAIEIYKALHTVSKAGPNTNTFNILLRGCHRARRKELAMFLAQEMTELKLHPDALTYDRLMLVCGVEGDYEDAMAYYEECVLDGFYPRKGTYDYLLNQAIARRDSRAVPLLKDYLKNIPNPSAFLTRLVRQTFEVGEQGKDEQGKGEKGKGEKGKGEEGKGGEAGAVGVVRHVVVG